MSTAGPWLGVVADDVTGAVDLAGEAAACGLGVVVVLGPPGPGDALPAGDVAVVALSSRTAPAASAVAQSAASARWLLAHGARWIYQKYCSTFDSTATGNIGPVADALADLCSGVSVGTPATPSVGRTQYLGHLFVGDRLVSESSLRDHPLTPMRDPQLVRVLGRQTARGRGLVPWSVVARGPTAVRERLRTLTADGAVHILVDALADNHLDTLAAALDGYRPRPLLGGAAGLATALARNRVAAVGATGAVAVPHVGTGPALVVAGSCSERTRDQVSRHRGPVLRLGAPEAARDAEGAVTRAVELLRRSWAEDRDAVPLVHSTAEPDVVRAEQAAVGTARAAEAIEEVLGEVARRAVTELGARRVLVAGGETSGAATAALGVRVLHLAARVEPGLSWTVAATDPAVALLLKSGNFGSPDLFATAWRSAP